jgi:hypothetical protein
MTDTRITAEQYQRISIKADKLFHRICGLMSQFNPPGGSLPAEWHELHELMNLAGVISAQADRYAARAREEEQPAPDLTPLAAERLYEDDRWAEDDIRLAMLADLPLDSDPF